MKKKLYLVLDTETATLPFSDTISKGDSEIKKKIAIAKPLVYDIGWIIMDRKGNILRKKNFLVQETFFVPNIFNTAYYKEKRPIYIEMMKDQQINIDCWQSIMLELMKDLDSVNLCCAYNACFDFKKAIPFTNQYISHLYSADFQEWMDDQKQKCKKIVKSGKCGKNPEYLEPIFKLFHKEYPICDLWGVSCEKLIAKDKYKKYCLDNSLWTNSVQFFKTSAETSFQYLLDQHDFIESHTALDDAIIESQILAKALKKGKVEPGIKPFPFRSLGTTFKYVTDPKSRINKDKKEKYKCDLKTALEDYISINEGDYKALTGNAYWKRMVKTLKNL